MGSRPSDQALRKLEDCWLDLEKWEALWPWEIVAFFVWSVEVSVGSVHKGRAEREREREREVRWMEEREDKYKLLKKRWKNNILIK